MVKVSNCCCCISVEVGVIILGVLACLNILEFIITFELFGFLLSLAVVGTFIAMLVKNMAVTRLAFLIAYIAEFVGCILLKFVVLKPEAGGFDAASHAASACSGMTEEDLAKFNESHGEDCPTSMKRYIMYSVIGSLSVVTLFFIHFVLVIATYYNEAVEAEEKQSGTPEEESEPLMDN